MGRFQSDIEEINHIVAELESDLDHTTARIERCLEQLDDLAEKIAQASKALRHEAALRRVNAAAGPVHSPR